MLPRAACACLLAAVTAVAAGCGSGTSTTDAAQTAQRPPARNATLILDFTPNAVHTGIYAALARHYDRDHGVRLHVIAPTATTDSIKLLETGKVDFAILDIHDLAIADESAPTQPGIVGIMAIVERPLAAVIAAPGIASPRELQGKTVGITPTRSTPPDSVRTVSRYWGSAAASCSMACALGSKASPAGVSSIRRVSRSNRTDDRPCSSFAICSDTDDWATPNSSAALVKLPSRATAQKHSSCRRSNFLSS